MLFKKNIPAGARRRRSGSGKPGGEGVQLDFKEEVVAAHVREGASNVPGRQVVFPAVFIEKPRAGCAFEIGDPAQGVFPAHAAGFQQGRGHFHGQLDLRGSIARVARQAVFVNAGCA